MIGHRASLPDARRRYRPRAGRSAPIPWSAGFAYCVGVITSDGSLSKDGRHVAITSIDRPLLDAFMGALGRPLYVGAMRNGRGGSALRVQIGDVALYDRLVGIGLTPRKSLTLGALAVPDEHFGHFLRGHLDGDGSILDLTYRGTGNAAGRTYRTLNVRFISGSRAHIEWLRERIHTLYGIDAPIGRAGVWTLTLAQRASLRLLPHLYPQPDVPCLPRKRAVWESFRSWQTAVQ